MEFVEGPTLADRIALGAIPADEAFAIASRSPRRWRRRTSQGIVHRDLKPANVTRRTDGTVKVLDFGLAKAMEPVTPASKDVSDLRTITTPAMTQAGVILGTAAYMSPEQARGKPVDTRTDIWAFGCRAVRDAHRSACLHGRGCVRDAGVCSQERAGLDRAAGNDPGADSVAPSPMPAEGPRAASSRHRRRALSDRRRTQRARHATERRRAAAKESRADRVGRGADRGRGRGGGQHPLSGASPRRRR